jgi:hypothetical protein
MLIELTFALFVGLPPVAPGWVNHMDRAEPLHRVDYILPARRVVTYPPEGELRMLSALPLSPAAQEAFDSEFARATYFSAFAVSKDGGWGFSMTTNSLGAAHAVALAECLRYNDQCLLIAEIVPAGYSAPRPGDITLTPEVVGYYEEFADKVGFKAFAVSADGAYAILWDVPTQAEADREALADCESYRTTGLAGLIDMPCVLLPHPK